MQLLLRHKLLIAGATAVAAASAGGAYAATQSDTNPRQAFLNDVAKHLNVSPAALDAAVKAALNDRINAAVKDGQITQAQAKKLEQALGQVGLPFPFFFAGPPPGFAGPPPGFPPGKQVLARRGGGTLHAAAVYLGLSNAQLIADLASGKSLAQVAKARGKSVSGLEQLLITAETKRVNQLQSRGVITKAQQQKILGRLSTRVNKLVNRAGFKRLQPGEVPRMLPPGAQVPLGAPPMPPGPAGFSPAGPGVPPPPSA
jgi:AraC-like DNA-binding protein